MVGLTGQAVSTRYHVLCAVCNHHMREKTTMSLRTILSNYGFAFQREYQKVGAFRDTRFSFRRSSRIPAVLMPQLEFLLPTRIRNPAPTFWYSLHGKARRSRSSESANRSFTGTSFRQGGRDAQHGDRDEGHERHGDESCGSSCSDAFLHLPIDWRYIIDGGKHHRSPSMQATIPADR